MHEREELTPFDPEIERTLRHLRRQAITQERTMADPNRELTNQGEQRQPRLMRDYMRPTLQNNVGITKTAINVNNLEFKPQLISMIRQLGFGGSSTEVPHDHLNDFIEICNTMKLNGVPQDII